MEEGETASITTRKELRREKLMEYLAAKGKPKLPNQRPYLGDKCPVKKAATLQVAKGKENRVPISSVGNEARKVPPVVSLPTQRPASKALVSCTVNVKGTVVSGRQNASRSSAPSDLAKSNRHQNPAFTRTYTVCSKADLSAARHVTKQPTSGRACGGTADTAVKKPSSTFSRTSDPAWSLPVRKTFASRISFGPLVKTKTGLTPAITEPRNTQRTSAPVPASDARRRFPVAKKVQSSVSSSLSVPKRSATATMKTTAQPTPVCGTTRTGIKAHDRSKPNSKPLLGQPPRASGHSRVASGLKATSTSSSRTAASVQLTTRADGSTKQRCLFEGGRKQPVIPRTSSRPASRRGPSGVGGFPPAAAAAEPRGCKDSGRTKGRTSQMAVKRSGAPVASQTSSRPGRSAESRVHQAPVRLGPPTREKKLTAAQEERMRKLQEWRDARGISYKRPPMAVGAQVRAPVKVDDEAQSFIGAVDRSLADCIKLLGEGCPPDQVKKVLTRLPPVAHKFTKYWICKVRLMEREGNLDVLPVFDEAMHLVLEPVDELRSVVFEILKKKDRVKESEENDGQSPVTEDSAPVSQDGPVETPLKPVRALICGERGDSSVVKYKITATPGCPSSQQREPVRVNGQEVRFFTPVRRSVRIERASVRYPASLQDHDLCVASYNDLMAAEENRVPEEPAGGESSDTPMYVYRHNDALQDKVLVQLVCDDAATCTLPTSLPAHCS